MKRLPNNNSDNNNNCNNLSHYKINPEIVATMVDMKLNVL